MTDCLPEHAKKLKVKPPSDGMKKVLVLYIGGCIGYSVDPDQPSGGLVHIKNKLRDHCKSDPSLNDINFQNPHSVEAHSFCVLPADNDPRLERVAYLLYEYDKLINSYNITPGHWKIIAKDIQANYEDFDGFVILHGEDTMAYTACALSFMCENLSKCLVITGAYRPIFDSRSDAKTNLKTSILVAGNYQIPEVTIFYRDRLLRGNRSIKRGADSLFGFDSLNVPPFFQIGQHMKENYQIPIAHKKCRLVVHTKLSPNVSFIRIYPGLPIQQVKACFEHPMEGVVMQTYGPGNIPSDWRDLNHIISEAVERGVIVTSCTQCPTGAAVPGSVLGTGQLFEDLGVILLSDMTVEAAITKLMYVLSKKKLSLDQKKKVMAKSIRGELTEIRM